MTDVFATLVFVFGAGAITAAVTLLLVSAAKTSSPPDTREAADVRRVERGRSQ